MSVLQRCPLRETQLYYLPNSLFLVINSSRNTKPNIYHIAVTVLNYTKNMSAFAFILIMTSPLSTIKFTPNLH